MATIEKVNVPEMHALAFAAFVSDELNHYTRIAKIYRVRYQVEMAIVERMESEGQDASLFHARCDSCLGMVDDARRRVATLAAFRATLGLADCYHGGLTADATLLY